MHRTRWALVVLGAAATLGHAAIVAGNEFYAGKTVSFVVGFAPGGSTDTTWRFIAPYYAKHLPGKPEVVVRNMAGGAGMNAQNFVYESARPDGLNLSANPWNSIGALTKAPGVRLDYTKAHFIGGFPDPIVTFVRTDVVPGGMKSPADIVKAKSIRLGGLRPDSTLDLSGRLSLELLGIKLNYIPGYPGAGQRRAAVMSNEIQATSIGYPEYKVGVVPTSVKAGEVLGLYHHSMGPRASIPDLPDFPSFYRKVMGAEPSGEKWDMLRTVYLATGVFLQSIFAPPNTPPEALKALRAGYLAMMQDKEMQAKATELFGGPIEFVPPEEGEKVIRALLVDTPPKVIEALKTYMAN